MIAILAGLPGTGKSTIARGLAERLGAAVLDKDRIRAALFSPAQITYTTAQDDFCQTIMLQTCAYLLRENPDALIVLDGRTFSRAYQLGAVQQFATQHNTSVVVIECVCSDTTARARLERDALTGAHLASNRTFALYQAIQARFEPIPEPKLVVNTDNDLEGVVDGCVAYICET